ncbi:hypothetical protein RHCRD62_40025 [Rhodococcus sp. RD6.2]|nr:hypothetical protein RHCRD62_40025 [Rhodococcus sp. RD6.2]
MKTKQYMRQNVRSRRALRNAISPAGRGSAEYDRSGGVAMETEVRFRVVSIGEGCSLMTTEHVRRPDRLA